MALPVLPFKLRFTSSRQLIPGSIVNNFIDLLTSFTDNITATAGGTAADSFPISSAYNNVTTVTTANDSVTLPPAQLGLVITITNSDAADSLRVFANTSPAVADTIKGAASFDMAATVCTTFVCNKIGTWRTFNAA